MILRTPQCDDDRCDYDTTGWVHDPGCRTQNARWGTEDMSLSSAREDGYSRAYGVSYDGLPAAWKAAA